MLAGLFTHKKLKVSLVGAAAMSALLSSGAVAQNAAPAKKPARVIEEVMVTAQKRDEALQDVPISMSVMDANFMVEQGVTDIREALLYVPNVSIDSAGFFVAPKARGFTFNNNNKAFEPPLGIAIDGVPYTRIPYFNAAAFDLKRIEVLRGPQGTTFGKNTTAGLIHMLTADATEEWTASVGAQSGDFDRERVELMVSGPVFPGVMNVRVAHFEEERSGFVENTTFGVYEKSQEEFRGNNRRGTRAKLDFPDLGGVHWKVSYEDVQLDDLGTGFELIRAGESVRDFLRGYDPNVDFEPDNYVASLDDPDGRSVNVVTWNTEVSYDLFGWGLVFVGGSSVLDQFLELDTDFTPAPATFGFSGDRSPTVTGEFRVVSPPLEGLFGASELFGRDLGSSDFVAGVFYQKRKINDSFFRFIFDMPSYLGLISAASSDDDDSDALGFLSFVPEDSFVEDFTQNYQQHATTLAYFGEFKWSFAENWTLQIGMRNGEEQKQAKWLQYYNQEQEAVVLPAAGVTPFSAIRKRTESQFQHKVAINWQPSENISMFLHRAEAVKGGGFNAFSFRGVDDELQFEPEYTTEWSFNIKSNWLDNTLRANFSVFRMDVTDFQVLSRAPERTTIGIGVTIVKNAAEAISQGVEGDVMWLVNDWLTLIGTIGYNDTEYKEFLDNECPPDMNSDPDCGDVSGEAFPFAPKWNNTLTASVRFPILNSGLEFTGSATIEQYSEQNLDVDLDPRKLQEGFERYKASIGLGHPQQGWTLKLIGENLSNKATGIRQGDLFAGVFVEIPEQPRTIYAQFNMEI